MKRAGDLDLTPAIGNPKPMISPSAGLRINSVKPSRVENRWRFSDSQSHSLCVGLRRTRNRQRYLRLAGSDPVLVLFQPTRIELFLREFRKLGYVEGKNIAIKTRHAEDKLDRLPGLADELVRLKVDVLLTPGGNGALALKNATRTIPIVFFGAVSDPVAAGLVDSLARPGGNITGFTTISAVLVGKRLELLKETVPNLSRVAVLWNPKRSRV